MHIDHNTTATSAVTPLARSSHRKVRSDAGTIKGSTKPRQDPIVTFTTIDSVEVALVPLAGVHGFGKTLQLDRADWNRVAASFDQGRRINVVQNGRKDGLTVYLEGPQAAAWAGTTANPRHLVTLARFVTSNRHQGQLVRVRNFDPFDLRRANLELEVRATRQRRPVDWPAIEQNERNA